MSGRQSGDSYATIGKRVVALAEQRWAIRCRDLRLVPGGDESIAWLATTDVRPLLLHLSPSWRRIEELNWVHNVIGRLAEHVPAIAPLATTDGSTALPIEGRLLSVFPFIEGKHLDREDPVQRTAAARLLAKFHRAQASLVFAARPASVPGAPTNSPRPADPTELVDPELDRWHASMVAAGLPGGLIHGDFYRRNLLWADERIVAIVDWHEAHHDLIAREVAWTIWEFAKGEGGEDLLPDRACEFLAAYEDGGPVLSSAEREALVPLIRWRLREEVRLAKATATRGGFWDADYAAAETAAFDALRGMTVRWR